MLPLSGFGIVNVLVDEEILDKDGKVDADRLQAISFDPGTMAYRMVGKKAGQAFSDGKALE